MNVNNLKPGNYKKLFSIEKGVGFLISDLFMHQYSKLDAMVIYHEGAWTAYMSVKSYDKCSKDGLKLFSDKAKFKSYTKAFDKFLLKTNKYLNKKDCEISALGWQEASELLKEVWTHYHKTEFFYQDLAHASSAKNITLKKNLGTLEHYKMAGRSTMNKLGFETIYEYMDRIAEKYNIKPADIKFLSQKEIYDLIIGKKPNLAIVHNRQKCFVIYSPQRQRQTIIGNAAIIVAKRFMLTNTEILEIRGTVANKGKAVGKARVILLNYNNIKSQLTEIAKMRPGEILVAETTSPEFTPALKKASAIVTNQGGLGSHAAIVSREFNIPCVVGTNIATSIIETGMRIEVDANKGLVKILDAKKIV